MKNYIVIKDLQGGSFGMSRICDEEQWREQAIEWETMDEHDGLVETLKELPNEKIIDFISEIWALEFRELTEEETEIFNQAIKDHRELNEIVSTWHKTISDLYVYLKGYNLDENLFDCNYKSITATICLKPHLYLSDYVDIWGKGGILLEDYEL